MGTSRNDPSPNTKPWRLSLALLGREGTGEDRQAQQIWRAALADRLELLVPSFADPAVFNASTLASEGVPPAAASARFDEVVHELGSASLVVDMAKRALVRTAAGGQDSATFTRELFAEATGYYASRDLPSVIGAEGRLTSARQAIDLKDGLQDAARQRVAMAGVPPKTYAEWPAYIQRVVRTLVGEV